MVDAESKIDVVRALFEEFAQHGSTLAFEVFDEEVVWDVRAALHLPAEVRGVYHGHEGVRRYWRQWLAAWEEVTLIDGPHLEAHGNQVISSWRQRNRGKRSGLEVDADVAVVWAFQHDRIVRAAAFDSRLDALVAAGIETE